MEQRISRRSVAGAAIAGVSSFAVLHHARGDAPINIRCSLDTAPSHPRNVAFRDFLGKLETASGGQIKTKLFESGALFPDLQVVKALVQSQVEMCCPGTWTITGFVPDADFSQLPAFYGRDLTLINRTADGKAGRFVNDEIARKLQVEVLGGWFPLGFYNWYSGRKKLTSLADLRNKKIRSPGGVLISRRIRHFGAIPSVTAWPNVPLAMAESEFDALITTNESVASAKLYESGLRHSLQDRQGTALYVPLVNHDLWMKLGPGLQGTMRTLWTDNLPAYRAARILVAERNFGCGSSREFAVLALAHHGIRAVIAPSFGDIFFNNCFMNGLLPIVLAEAEAGTLREEIEARPGAALTIDLAAQTVTGPDGKAYSFAIDGFRKHCLLEGVDELDFTRGQGEAIAAFEARQTAEMPWL